MFIFVLLPPEEVMDICIEVNKKGDADFELGKDDFVPHNSLCMAVVEEEKSTKGWTTC